VKAKCRRKIYVGLGFRQREADAAGQRGGKPTISASTTVRSRRMPVKNFRRKLWES
jgi:hypothetical protein